MKIFYDNIIYSLQKAGGISTYWSELSKRLLRDKIEIEFLEMPNANLARQQLNIPTKQILFGKRVKFLDRFKPVPIPSSVKNILFHSSYNRIGNNPLAKQVLTIHDFVHEKFYRGVRRYLHVYQKNKAIAQANKIITVSENTKKDLLQHHPKLAAEKVVVIYNGVSDGFFPIEQINSVSESPYILFIGSRAKYKNFDFAVEVLAKLTAYHFHIVGNKLSDQEEKLLNQKIPNRWKLHRGVKEEQLNYIYNDAFALIYPSSYEGFGIPLLETMKAGTPFVALNTSSIPEVAGEAGVLIDQLIVEDFIQGIQKIERNREVLQEKGWAQVKKFSWEKCYQETLAVYKELGL